MEMLFVNAKAARPIDCSCPGSEVGCLGLNPENETISEEIIR